MSDIIILVESKRSNLSVNDQELLNRFVYLEMKGVEQITEADRFTRVTRFAKKAKPVPRYGGIIPPFCGLGGNYNTTAKFSINSNFGY